MQKAQALHRFALCLCVIAILTILVIWQLYRNDRQVALVAGGNNQGTTLNQTSDIKPENKISTLIIPHHDIVKDIRQQFLQKIAPSVTSPSTIILLSPNHYDLGLGDIQTTDQTWQLGDKTISPDEIVLSSLSGLASNEPGSFANEHGVRNVLADIWQVFPNARIVPIILKRTSTKDEITSLNEQLKQTCSSCLLIASVDFSHYQTALLADLHDQTTERLLDSLNVDELLHDAEVDSPPALALAANWASAQQTERFVLDKHTNSGVVSKLPNQETTSHFFGYYATGEKTVPLNSVNFIIGGDMMFGRMIAHTFLKDGLWHSVDQLGERLFWGTDASIVNLEGPVSDSPVKDNIEPNNLIFNFPPQTIQALQFLHVNAAGQGNNHSGNAGNSGLETTRKLLLNANFQTFGGPSGFDPTHVATFNGSGLTLDVLGVNLLPSQPDLTKEIAKLKTNPTHRIMVFYHGGNEYQSNHSSAQERMAHAWIDAGADIVIGAHPHVIQDSEIYKGKPIFYSLGNLLFDQTFSKETQQGLLVAGSFSDTGISVFAQPVQSKNNKPAPILGSTKSQLLEAIYRPFTQYLRDTPSGSIIEIPN